MPDIPDVTPDRQSMNDMTDFSALKISLASPEAIRTWSHGEVTKPETINYRTLRPEKDGLFDERIFGPTKDWECYCGKYKRIRYKGVVCDKCGVEVTHSRVRRERLGHITLAASCVHIWFFKGAPSVLSLLLNIPPKAVESIIYFTHYLVLTVDHKAKKEALQQIQEHFTRSLSDLEKKHKEELAAIEKQEKEDIGEVRSKIKQKEAQDINITEIKLKTKQYVTRIKERFLKEKSTNDEFFKRILSLARSLKPLSVLAEEEYLRLADLRAVSFFTVKMGAEAIETVLEELDLDKLAATIREETQKTQGQKHIKSVKRLRIVEGLRKSKINPTWMIQQAVPVIPPDLRPMVQLAGGRFATSDLNDLYRRVINRNNRLKHLINLGAPEIILRNEKRMLQEAVDSLIDSSHSRKGRTVRRKLRSLTDMLRGKQGRFRQNLLGKRVDYSGRSVIVVGPDLDLSQCGIPKDMALEMFKPFVLRELLKRGIAQNVKNAKTLLDERIAEVFDILEEITKNHPVLLNRAPTLHKLGIQAFYPILIEGSAIRLHPCVCSGYNADFDGDQMAVHIPISEKSIEEAVQLMMPSQNLLKPADGSPVSVPNKGMALGIYYLTSVAEEQTEEIKEAGKKAKFNKEQKQYTQEEAIYAWQTGKIGLRQVVQVTVEDKILPTTVGRVLFNEKLPEELQFINKEVNASYLKKIVMQALHARTKEEVAHLIDEMKNLGFWAETQAGGVSVSVFDCKMLPNKDEFINKAEGRVAEIEENYNTGLITSEERRRLTNNVWIETTEQLADRTWSLFDKENSARIIIDSGGARASRDQIKQLSAMRGLVVDPLGKVVPLPTKSNFRQGLSIFEYVTSARGSRKGLTDSALKTADAGYLTRRLVDVSHDAIIRMNDCGTKEGIEVSTEDPRTRAFTDRLIGRVLSKDVKKGKKVIVKRNKPLTNEELSRLAQDGVTAVTVRSSLTCAAKYGICQMCYGWDMGSFTMVTLGTPIGVVAAQSIGEPGTQLTLRVKHAGGIVGLDVTQGLPRVEELFEARIPKMLSPIAEIPGKVSVKETDEGYKVIVKSLKVKPVEERAYLIPLAMELQVKNKELIPAGMQLAGGFLDLREVLRIRGLRGSQQYLLNELQHVYESQGIIIDDRHFEIIIRKMSDKVRIKDPGDATFLIGEVADRVRFEEENARILASGGEPATAEVVILGISQATFHTDSWLSAASFENTSNVLTEASVLGEVDRLLGLKENVIIGRLIPTSPDRAVIEEVIQA
ncbi:DNA-directed RNA polymerase subunit beta' [Candidatus Roizmanbacteria bacterium]|nr:DNA-directed RNA polymerase subunit beta' [Candidatus Roizmanbacteria bacterium]